MKDRLASLDAMRGADMFGIMGMSGGSGLVVALLLAFGMQDTSGAVQFFKHVSWEGLAIHDTIFPTFLFLAGVSWPFSYAAQLAKGRSMVQIVLRNLKRAAILFFFGLVVNRFFKLDFAHLRIPGVLQFIGLSWFFATMVYMFVKNKWARVAIAVALLVGYWAILAFNVAPDAPVGKGAFSYEGNICGYFDRSFLKGHIIGICDPEGFISLLSGTVTALLGVFAGEIVRSDRFSKGRRALIVAGMAAGLLMVGLAWQPWCPCIKKLWTPVFALFAGAYSAGVFSLFYWLCDVKEWRKWSFVFRVVGMNSITIYMAQMIIPFNSIDSFFLGGLAGMMPGAWGTVLLRAGYVVVCWLFLYFLYRKNVFLRV